ncbi:D-erythrulose-4-phosphate isomerase 1 [Salmonella enterica subsp. enterica serovar Derby]|nr:D-erythrulose-4-phosphate isomerase 1 [Salmonella enterica subsp. enterica serovar Derby]
MGLRIVVAADPAAVEYKDVVKADLEADSRVDDVIDVGVQAGDDTLYPRIGIKGAHVIKDACTAHDSFSVERLIMSNDAHVLCLGQRVIGRELARRLAHEFIGYTFDPSSHSKANIDLIDAYESGAGESAPGNC